MIEEKATRIARNIIDAVQTKYDEETHIPLLIITYLNGRDIAAFCYEAEICKKTFHNWLHKYKLFRTAYNIALPLAQVWWEETARVAITDAMTFNNKLFEITMRNRFGYTEHRRLNIPNLKTAKNLKEQIECVMNYMADGELTAPEANQVSNLILAAMKVDEKSLLDTRLEAIEEMMMKQGASS